MSTEDPAWKVGCVSLLHCQAGGQVGVKLRVVGNLGVVGGLAEHQHQEAELVRHCCVSLWEGRGRLVDSGPGWEDGRPSRHPGQYEVFQYNIQSWQEFTEYNQITSQQ